MSIKGSFFYAEKRVRSRKRFMDRLAVDGGMPVRTEKIYYGRQWIDEEDVKAVSEVLTSDFVTCGPKVAELERALAEYTGAGYAVAVSNGTAALHCACIAAGIGPGDEVITTPLTFAASANCALYCGAQPVFADVDPKTYNIDPASIESHITEKTKAVVAVDFTGQAAKIREIREICDKHGLIFIEDAAHSIGTKYEGKPAGSLADMTCFSFHPVKTITSGEGGAVTSNDRELYKKLVLAHTHGITHEEEQMEEGPHEGPWYYEQISLGYNYRMTDFQAALLLSQLKKLDRFAERRKEIVRRYNEAFQMLPEIIVQEEIPESDTCRHLYIIRLDLERLACTRRQFYDAMAAENVQCQIHYVPVYWFPYYRHLGYKKGLCPNAEEIYKGIVSIPLYPRMTGQDVEDVIRAVKKIVQHYRK
jgi:UDP-4-amino-4,6-dideoxy-N-acetyl-beta-L-altrosamine transaminase